MGNVANYGLDSNSGRVSDEFMRGIKEFNYKTLTIVNYNSAKAVLIATAQHNFSKEMVAGCYLAVDTLAHMVLPFIPRIGRTADLLDGLNKLLQELEKDYGDIYSMDRVDRSKYVQKCEQVIVKITPNLSRVGIGATIKAVGTFSYDQIVQNKIKKFYDNKRKNKK